MFFPSGIVIRPASLQPPKKTSFSRSHIPSNVLKSGQENTNTRQQQQQQQSATTSSVASSFYQQQQRPTNPSIHPSPYPMRPTSSEQQYYQRPSRKQTTAKRILKQKAKKRAQINKRNNTYKVKRNDGRIKQLTSAQGNAYNARPNSSSSSSSSPRPRSRDTWVPSKTPRVNTYQVPRSTTIDTAFTLMAGTVSASPRRSLKQRRPFRDMVEVKKLTEHQQTLNQRNRSQIQSDISLFMSLGMRRNDALRWCGSDTNNTNSMSTSKQNDNVIDIHLRVIIKHLSMINIHRSHDFMTLQTRLEKNTTLSIKSATTNTTDTTTTTKTTTTTTTTPLNDVVDLLLLYECREEARIERETKIMHEIQIKLRTDSTHGTDAMSDLEDYTPMLVVDLQQALQLQQNRMVQIFRTLSVNQKAVLENMKKWSAIKIQKVWSLYLENRRHNSAFLIQQKWAKYMCNILNHRVFVQDSRQQWSAWRIQKYWKIYMKLKKSDVLNYLKDTYIDWLNTLMNGNDEYDQYDHDVSRSCLVLQCSWRVHVAFSKVKAIKRKRDLQTRAKRRNRWENRRGGKRKETPLPFFSVTQNKRDVYLAYRELVMWHTHLTSEMEHVKIEIGKEYRGMAKAWKRWEIHMRKQIYNKPIPNHYIAQIDTGPNAWTSSSKGGGWNQMLKKEKSDAEKSGVNGSGGSGGDEAAVTSKQQWLSLKTGEMTDIHPHFQEANELALKESQKCHIILKERIEHLEKYWFTLKESLTRHQNVISRRIIELCEGDSGGDPLEILVAVDSSIESSVECSAEFAVDSAAEHVEPATPLDFPMNNLGQFREIEITIAGAGSPDPTSYDK